MSNNVTTSLSATRATNSTAAKASNRNVDDSDQTRESNSQFPVAELIACTTVIGSLSLVAPFVLGYARTPLPYMATPASKVNRALSFVMKRKLQHNKSKSLTFLDLGCGDGEAVYQASKLGFHKSVGIELNWTLYFVCQFRRNFWWLRDERKRTSFYCQDFFRTSPTLMSNATVVMIFGVPTLMHNVSRMLARHCLPGTCILSYRFPLPLQEVSVSALTVDEPNSIETTKSGTSLLRAELIYDDEGMRIYEYK